MHTCNTVTIYVNINQFPAIRASVEIIMKPNSHTVKLY